MGCRIVYSEMISFRDNIKSFTTEYIAGLDDLKEVTHEFSAMDSFQGKTATRVKDYMRDVSLVTIKGMRFLHEEFSNIIDAYVRGYLENIDPATDTIIDCDCLEELINDNHSAHQTFKEVNDEINAIIDESSLDLPEPSGGTINALYENITNNLVGLRTAVGEYEYAHRNDMAELSQLANALSNFMKAHAKFHTDVSNLPFSIPKDNFYNRLNDMVKDREERKSQLADESEHIVEEAPTTFIELKAQIIMLGNVPMLWWQMSLVKREEVYGVIKQATHDVRMQLSAEHQRIMERYVEWIEKPVLLEHVWDSYTRERILTLNPAIRQMTINFIVEMQAHGMNLRISQAFRTNEEQDRLYNQSRNGNTEPRVTRARGGESYHNYGMAIDVVEIINKETNWQFDIEWVANIAMQYGFEWPMPEHDSCHFQVSKGYTTRQLLEMVRNGNTKDGHIVFE